jgi:hypothetical protein
LGFDLRHIYSTTVSRIGRSLPKNIIIHRIFFLSPRHDHSAEIASTCMSFLLSSVGPSTGRGPVFWIPEHTQSTVLTKGKVRLSSAVQIRAELDYTTCDRDVRVTFSDR